MPTTSIRNMTQVMDEHGLCAEPLLESVGLTRDALLNPEVLVTGVQELDFQRRFVELTGPRYDLWVRTGQLYRWLHYGPGGLAASTAPSLHELASTLPIWAHLTYSVNVAVPIRDDESASFVGIEFDLTEVPRSLRAFTVFRDMGAATTFFQDVLAFQSQLLRFEFSFRDPGIADLKEMLKAKEIVFASRRSGYIWGKDIARNPMPNSDPVLHESYLGRCREIMEQIPGKRSFLDALFDVLEQLPDTPSIADLARELGVSKRTLQRRMQEHGMNYHDLRGTVLARRARSLLRDTTLPIAEVAWEIGYSDPTAFTHAFNRWTGLSPRTFRSAGPKDAKTPPENGGA